MDVKIDASWKAHLQSEFEQPYFAELVAFVKQEYMTQKVYPPGKLMFNAFDKCPFDQVKVVILGQDPYPTQGHAHGLSFSVLPTVKPLPRSLNNIYKELKSDLGIDNKHTGYLQPWAEQGVLLLNTVLSVEEGNANSHQKRGWERFTDEIIKAVNAQDNPVVFILWGAPAQKKAALIDETKHLIIKSAHPSPLSAKNGFFDSKPFSRSNAFLVEQGRTPINWQL